MNLGVFLIIFKFLTITIIHEWFRHEFKYFFIFRILEILFITCGEIFIIITKLKICKFLIDRFKLQTLKFDSTTNPFVVWFV